MKRTRSLKPAVENVDMRESREMRENEETILVYVNYYH